MFAYTTADLDEMARRISTLALEKLQIANVVSERQGEIVYAVGRILAHLAGGRIAGRHCIAGPFGLGKTTCIKSAVAVLGHETEDLGLLILQQKIEAGRELRDEALEWMRERGWPVNPKLIAHVHNEHDGMKPGQARPYRFVLATHERSRRESIETVVRNECGERRNVVVDEVLHAAWATGANLATLEKSLKRVEIEYDNPYDPVADTAVTWCRDVVAMVRAKLEIAHIVAVETNDAGVGLEPVAMKIPTIEDDGLRGRVLKLLERRNVDARNFVHLLEASTRDDHVRLMRTSKLTLGVKVAGAVLQHRRTMSASLRNVVSFDAGAEVDKLLELDDEIELATTSLKEFFPAWAVDAERLIALKSYEKVDVVWMDAAGGKKSMTTHFSMEREPWIADEVAKLVVRRLQCDGRRVLICGHLDSDFADKIRRALVKFGVRAADVGWDEVPTEGQRHLVEFTHFGLHDALNAWQDAGTVIAVGCWAFSHEDAAAIALGQMTTEKTPAPLTPDTPTIQSVQRSRVATTLGQLAGRGACRRMQDGMAEPMLFAFIYHDSDPEDLDGRTQTMGPLCRLLQRLLPGARWWRWPVPEVGRPGEATQTDAVAAKVDALLVDMMKEDIEEAISTKALRRRLGLPRAEVSGDVFSMAVARALTSGNHDWIRKARGAQTLVRGSEARKAAWGADEAFQKTVTRELDAWDF